MPLRGALLSLLFLLLLLPLPANATTSTINPQVPAQNSPLTSSVVRGNFLAAYNDINNLWNALAALPSGVLTINGSSGAFTFTGSGVSCTGQTCTFNGGSGGSVTWPAQYDAVFSAGVSSNPHGVAVADGYLLIGQSGTYPAAEAVSGDCTLADTGALTCTKSNGASFGTAAFDNTGTSGGTIPLLNGNWTASGNVTFSGGIKASGLSSGTVASNSYIGLDSSNNLVLGSGGSGGGTVTLGTSTSATNPQRSSEAGTGFYSDTDAEVEVAISGSNVSTWSSSGLTAVTFVPTGSTPPSTGGLYFPASNTPAIGANGYIATLFGSNGSVVNYAELISEATTTAPVYKCRGNDTNVGCNFITQGTGAFTFETNGSTLAMTIGSTGANLASGLTYQINGSQISCSNLSNGATGCSTATGTSGATIPLLNGANTWSGVQSINSGDLALKGSSSGVTTLNANSASGTVTATLPANTGIISELNYAQTWSALQKYTNADFALLGSSTGYTLLESGLGSTSNNTLTLPTTATDTLAALGTAETWTAAQTFTDSDILLLGSSTGYTTFTSTNAGSSNYVFYLPAYTGYAVTTQSSAPAQGDILYFNGTDWVDLGAGTTGEFLETQGASANPQWASASASTITLGTSASATNPQRSSQAGTGLYSDTTNQVEVATGGYESALFTAPSSSVNYVEVLGAITGHDPGIVALGSDTNVNLGLNTQGTGSIQLATSGTVQANISYTASAVDYVNLTGSAAGSPGIVTISGLGSDTNVGINIIPKGSGGVAIGTTSAASDTLQVNGSAAAGSPVSLVISTATFTPTFNTGNDFIVTLVHASCPCTLANPSGTIVPGQHGVIYIIQSSTGSDTVTTWGSEYLIAGGTAAITLSSGANDIDVFTYAVKDSTHIILSGPALNVAH